MRFLSTYPEPQEVCDALLSGAFMSFGAQSVNIILTTPHATYKVVGATGISLPIVPRYQEFSALLNTAVKHAVHEAEIITTSLLGQITAYPALEIDRPIWEELANATGDLGLEIVPIVSNGMAIGAFTLFRDPSIALSRADYSMLSGIGHLLGIWATHPLTESNLETNIALPSNEIAFMLNDRQLQVLELVELGRSNAAIGVILGYSQSTVKQDLQRAMRVLRASDRTEAAQRARDLGLHSVQND